MRLASARKGHHQTLTKSNRPDSPHPNQPNRNRPPPSDRMSVPRGPCPLHVLKDAWVQGAIDENTMVWGHGLYDWLPAKNVKLLLPMVRTPEGESLGLGRRGWGRDEGGEVWTAAWSPGWIGTSGCV